ncbi:MAG TPA: SLC13 family permease [Bacteroidales bacterium]|nr:SLC13 family permease [Bacteroidales bacterium]HPS17881.1 SLC13 family permease [Bacteroidales bacterium]
MERIELIALIIFILTYIGIIFTRLPKMNIDRPSAAFFGAVAMVIFGVLTFNEAILAIDFNTITLLLGMMIIISTLQLDGFFSLIAHKTISFAGNQTKLLVIVVFITGVASAFLVNDAVVLIFTPVIIMICQSSGINPIPYLIAEILSSNAGSAMSITGNPQNMLIGLNSEITYNNFLLHLLPVSILSMIVIIIIIRWLYPSCFRIKQTLVFQENNFGYNYSSMKTSVPVFIFVIVLFFLSNIINLSIPLIALAGGSLILIFGRIKPSLVIKQIDWVLLLFFASLFIVVEGIHKTGLLSNLVSRYPLTDDLNGIMVIHGISFIGSQIVSNVPLTVVLLPFMKAAGSDMLWLSLASASTLAGNATIIGAMANLIVIESAEKQKVKIKFMEFFKAGIIVTLITLILSILIIYFEQIL